MVVRGVGDYSSFFVLKLLYYEHKFITMRIFALSLNSN